MVRHTWPTTTSLSLSHGYLDGLDDAAHLAQGVRHPPLEGGLVVNFFGTGIDGNINQVKLLQLRQFDPLAGAVSDAA